MTKADLLKNYNNQLFDLDRDINKIEKIIKDYNSEDKQYLGRAFIKELLLTKLKRNTIKIFIQDLEKLTQ